MMNKDSRMIKLTHFKWMMNRSITEEVAFQIDVFLDVWANAFILFLDLSSHSCNDYVHLLILSLPLFEQFFYLSYVDIFFLLWAEWVFELEFFEWLWIDKELFSNFLYFFLLLSLVFYQELFFFV